MIDFRYHLVSIVAVFLALAIGIVLGTTTLRDPLLDRVDNVAATLRGTNEDLRAEVTSLRQQVDADQAIVQRLAPGAVGGRLGGETVVVVQAPGSSDGLRREIVSLIEKAGGTVTGRVSVQQKYLDNSEKGVVDGLATRLKPSGLRVPEGAAYERAGRVLANALVTDGQEQAGAAVGETVLSGFETAGYVAVDEQPDERATLAVMLVPAGSVQDKDEAAEAPGRALTTLAYALDQRGQGAVLAGPKSAATEGGLIYALRGRGPVADSVSTVDFADTSTGRVVTVFALDMELENETGHYGLGPRAQAYLPTNMQDQDQPDQQDQQGASSPGAQ